MICSHCSASCSSTALRCHQCARPLRPDTYDLAPSIVIDHAEPTIDERIAYQQEQEQLRRMREAREARREAAYQARREAALSKSRDSMGRFQTSSGIKLPTTNANGSVEPYRALDLDDLPPIPPIRPSATPIHARRQAARLCVDCGSRMTLDDYNSARPRDRLKTIRCQSCRVKNTETARQYQAIARASQATPSGQA